MNGCSWERAATHGGFCLAMTKTTQSLRYAGSAIAAALALASTSSFAQDAAVPFQPAPEPAPAPVIVVPDIPAPAAERPTIVVPPVQTETVQSVPTTSAETPAPQAAPSPAATTTRTRAATPATRATVPAPAARTTVQESAPLPPVSVAEPTAAEPVAAPIDEPVAAAPVNEPARAVANDDTGLLTLILGGLVFLAMAIWGFVAIGRRKGVRRYAAETTAQPVAVTPATVVAEPAPVVVAEPVAVNEPVAMTPRDETRLNGPSFASRAAPATAGALPHAGASVALPARVPESYAERDALMKRMIAAKPDRANPFTDRGARTRRARLILQSLGRDFGETEPWIDLSQYPNNWPELANKRSVAA